MNRIKISPLASMPTVVEKAQPQSFQQKKNLKFTRDDCNVFVPMHYEPNYAYPLVVWLHGDCQQQNEMVKYLPLISTRNYVGLAVGSSHRVEFGEDSWPQTSEQIDRAEGQIASAISTVRSSYNIHPERVFLVGVGSGGTMAYRVAFSNPERFGGVCSINGSFPEGLTPLRHLNLSRRLPIISLHGRESEQMDESQLCRDLKLLHIAGFNLVVRQYPCGDRLPDQMFADLNRWLMELVTGTPCELPDDASKE